MPRGGINGDYLEIGKRRAVAGLRAGVPHEAHGLGRLVGPA